MRRAGGATVPILGLVAAVVVVSVIGSPGGHARNDPNPSRGRLARVTVVNQNILHGIFCPDDTERCQVADRVALFARQIAAAHCPQIVAVEEANAEVVGLLRQEIVGLCGGRYQLVAGEDPSVDREVVLTTLDVLGHERVRLAGPLRTALWVRMRAPVGRVDLVATHLASSIDDGPCEASTCPPPCELSDSLNTCQARQVADLLDERRSARSVGVLAGDLNAKPKEPTIDVLRAHRFVDTHRAAGKAECNPRTGNQCTSGRADDDLSDLTDPESQQAERIDYVFLATERRCRVVRPTGLFAAAPARRPINDLVFASDHTGVRATIACR